MSFDDHHAVDLLRRMVCIPSLCGQEEQVATLLEAEMTGVGFDVQRDTVGNVIGSFIPGSMDPEQVREVVILGHMDTVPGTIAVEERDGALYGRGSVDAKGPLATGLVAAARASRRCTVRVTVIGAVQEEGPSVGARYLMQRRAPDYLIISEPSAWDAVVLGYKGSLRFTVDITVPNGHTAGPESTAPERACTFWQELVGWCERRVDANDEFHRLTPTLIGIQSSNNGLDDRAVLYIGLRLPLGIEPEQMQREIPALLPEGTFHFNAGEAAIRGKKSNPLVAGFLRSIRAESGTPRFKVKTGTSDMNVVGPVWDCPMVAYGPGDSRLDHTPHEHIRIDEYLRAIRVLTCVLEEL